MKKHKDVNFQMHAFIWLSSVIESDLEHIKIFERDQVNRVSDDQATTVHSLYPLCTNRFSCLYFWLQSCMTGIYLAESEA